MIVDKKLAGLIEASIEADAASDAAVDAHEKIRDAESLAAEAARDVFRDDKARAMDARVRAGAAAGRRAHAVKRRVRQVVAGQLAQMALTARGLGVELVGVLPERGPAGTIQFFLIEMEPFGGVVSRKYSDGDAAPDVVFQMEGIWWGGQYDIHALPLAALAIGARPSHLHVLPALLRTALAALRPGVAW
jgi:hypothetical protein